MNDLDVWLDRAISVTEGQIGVCAVLIAARERIAELEAPLKGAAEIVNSVIRCTAPDEAYLRGCLRDCISLLSQESE